jgi:AraC-like DNA-binding protein
MELKRHLPRPPLAALVDYLWHLSDAPVHARERILPSGTLELVFNLAEDEVRLYDDLGSGPCRRLPGAVISGVYSRFFVIDTQEHACMMGVHFKPGGAFPFLRRTPALELADSHRELAALWGDEAPRLREQLRAAKTVPERFARLEAALQAELGRAPPGHRVVPPALQALAAPGTPITMLAEQANLSHRRLIQLFGHEVGSTPKLFQRLQRFQRALELTRERSRPSSATARLAQHAGYCDQSHWIRDCVAFSGLTPAQYASQWTGLVKGDHLPLLAEPAVELRG